VTCQRGKSSASGSGLDLPAAPARKGSPAASAAGRARSPAKTRNLGDEGSARSRASRR